MVSRMDANVDGRPIPFSSNVFTREASVNRAGGFVLCDSDFSVLQTRVSPSTIAGRTRSLFARSLFGLSRPST